MSQEHPPQPATTSPEFVIPEWFQEEDANDLPPVEPVALPDIFDDLYAVREPDEPVVPPSGPRATPHPPGEGLRQTDSSRAQRLFEIASALGFMAGTLRTWDHEGAEGAAHLLASLAAELAGIAATGDHS